MKTNNVQIIELDKEAIKKIVALNLHFKFRNILSRSRSQFGF